MRDPSLFLVSLVPCLSFSLKKGCISSNELGNLKIIIILHHCMHLRPLRRRNKKKDGKLVDKKFLLFGSIYPFRLSEEIYISLLFHKKGYLGYFFRENVSRKYKQGWAYKKNSGCACPLLILTSTIFWRIRQHLNFFSYFSQVFLLDAARMMWRMLLKKNKFFACLSYMEHFYQNKRCNNNMQPSQKIFFSSLSRWKLSPFKFSPGNLEHGISKHSRRQARRSSSVVSFLMVGDVHKVSLRFT